jgi:uncharacterized membrane protein YphA (DoxX/SURF4 family)
MSLTERWERFWFEPVSTATLGVFRVAYGLILLAWGLAISADGMTFFSRSGILPAYRTAGAKWGLLSWFGSDATVIAVITLLIVAAVCIIIGFKTRLACAVAFVALIALTRRNPFLFNSGDALLRNISLFMMLAPCGAALSVDAWRASREAFWSFPKRAPWALRLVQVQISMLYLFTVWAKARGERWIAGTAVSESLRVADITRFHVPYAWSNSLLLANLLTYGTLVVELSLAIFIWNRRMRPWVIAAGIALHLFIELVFALGFFSLVMITSYVAFVPEDSMENRLIHLRGRLRRSRFAGARRMAAAGDPGVAGALGTSVP